MKLTPKKSGGLLLALAFLIVTQTGCALFSKSATTEQKLSEVRNLAYAAASFGTREALIQNQGWRPQFEAAYVQLNQLVSQKIVTGDLLRTILAGLPVRELKSEQARIAIESATVLYDATVGSKINIESAPYVLAAAQGIRDGLKIALNL